MTFYVDTSAVAKLLVQEPESEALSDYLDRLVASGAAIVSSVLLETELRRLAVRAELGQDQVTALLDRFDLYEPDRAAYMEAGLLPSVSVRSLDAVHVVTAIRVEADAIVTYDERQAEAARQAGLRVVAPAAE